MSYIRTNHSPGTSTVESHLSSIAYHYRLQGVRSLTEDAQVKMYVRGIKRLNQSIPVKRAKPMTADVLSAMRNLLESKPSLVLWRTVWRAQLEFSLMLRYVVYMLNYTRRLRLMFL